MTGISWFSALINTLKIKELHYLFCSISTFFTNVWKTYYSSYIPFKNILESLNCCRVVQESSSSHLQDLTTMTAKQEREGANSTQLTMHITIILVLQKLSNYVESLCKLPNLIQSKLSIQCPIYSTD